MKLFWPKNLCDFLKTLILSSKHRIIQIDIEGLNVEKVVLLSEDNLKNETIAFHCEQIKLMFYLKR